MEVSRNLPDSGGERKGRVVLVDGKSTLLPCTDPPGKCSFVVAQVCSLSSGDVLHEQGSLLLAVSPECHSKSMGSPACSRLQHLRGFQGLSHDVVALSHGGSKCESPRH